MTLSGLLAALLGTSRIRLPRLQPAAATYRHTKSSHLRSILQHLVAHGVSHHANNGWKPNLVLEIPNSVLLVGMRLHQRGVDADHDLLTEVPVTGARGWDGAVATSMSQLDTRSRALFRAAPESARPGIDLASDRHIAQPRAPVVQDLRPRQRSR